MRSAAEVALLAGGALLTTLLRPAAGTSLARGTLIQLVLAGGCAAVLGVLDPLAVTYGIAAQRELHGDEVSRRAALSEIVRLGRDFRGLSLANLDLSSLDLSGADLRGVDLSGANLTHAKLFAAEVQGARFDGARLAGADLGQVALGLASLGTAACDAENPPSARLALQRRPHRTSAPVTRTGKGDREARERQDATPKKGAPQRESWGVGLTVLVAVQATTHPILPLWRTLSSAWCPGVLLTPSHPCPPGSSRGLGGQTSQMRPRGTVHAAMPRTTPT